jgi:hypothetical protein
MAERTTVNSVFSSAGAATRGRGRDGDGSGGGDAELLFHCLDELGELEDGHRRDLVEDFGLGCGHCVLLDLN